MTSVCCSVLHLQTQLQLAELLMTQTASAWISMLGKIGFVPTRSGGFQRCIRTHVIFQLDSNIWSAAAQQPDCLVPAKARDSKASWGLQLDRNALEDGLLIVAQVTPDSILDAWNLRCQSTGRRAVIRVGSSVLSLTATA